MIIVTWPDKLPSSISPVTFIWSPEEYVLESIPKFCIEAACASGLNKTNIAMTARISEIDIRFLFFKLSIFPYFVILAHPD